MKSIKINLFSSVSETEYFGWLSASFGVLLIILLSTLVTANGFVTSDKYAVVIALLLIAPFLTLLVCSKKYKFIQNPIAPKLLFINLSFIFLAILQFGALNLAPLMPKFGPRAFLILYAISVAAFFLLQFFYKNSVKRPLINKIIFLLNLVLILIIPTLMLAVVILPMNWYNANNFHSLAAKYCSWLALATLLIWYLRPNNRYSKWIYNKYLRYGTTLLGCLFPFLLIDPNLSYDVLHYTAYLGPSSLISSGRIPLIDVFSQYGQSYLVYFLGMYFLPKNYHAAALVTSILNVAMLVLSIIILRRFIKNNLTFLVLAITLPFFYWMIYHYNPNGTPSHGGLRYLPVYMLAATLVWMKTSRIFTLSSVSSLFLSFVWSFEATIYSIFIYESFILIKILQNSSNIKKYFNLFITYNRKFIILIAVFLSSILLTYLATVGEIPRYDLYLSLVLSYVGSNSFIDYSWFQEGFYTWVPILTGYFTVICLISRQFYLNKDKNSLWIREACVLFSLGISVGIYCIISSQAFILKPVLLPIYLFLYWGLGRVIEYRRDGTFFNISILGLGPVFIFLWFLLGGTSFGNFFEYPNPTTTPTLLGSIINKGQGSALIFYDAINSFCASSSKKGDVCSKSDKTRGDIYSDPQFKEIKILLDRWQSNSPTLMTFSPMDTIMQVYYQKPHLFPLSFSYVDGFSPELFKYIVDRSKKIIANDIHDGQTIVITDNLDSLNNLQWALLTEISYKWNLEKIDELGNLSVYKFVKKSEKGNSDLLQLPIRDMKNRNSIEQI